MSRPCKYPWFTWFNEDTHRIARWVFSSMSDKSIISTVQIQAKRMSVFAKVSVCERWVWITATRKTLAFPPPPNAQNHLAAASDS